MAAGVFQPRYVTAYASGAFALFNAATDFGRELQNTKFLPSQSSEPLTVPVTERRQPVSGINRKQTIYTDVSIMDAYAAAKEELGVDDTEHVSRALQFANFVVAHSVGQAAPHDYLFTRGVELITVSPNVFQTFYEQRHRDS